MCSRATFRHYVIIIVVLALGYYFTLVINNDLLDVLRLFDLTSSIFAWQACNLSHLTQLSPFAIVIPAATRRGRCLQLNLYIEVIISCFHIQTSFLMRTGSLTTKLTSFRMLLFTFFITFPLGLGNILILYHHHHMQLDFLIMLYLDMAWVLCFFFFVFF